MPLNDAAAYLMKGRLDRRQRIPRSGRRGGVVLRNPRVPNAVWPLVWLLLGWCRKEKCLGCCLNTLAAPPVQNARDEHYIVQLDSLTRLRPSPVTTDIAQIWILKQHRRRWWHRFVKGGRSRKNFQTCFFSSVCHAFRKPSNAFQNIIRWNSGSLE